MRNLSTEISNEFPSAKVFSISNQKKHCNVFIENILMLKLGITKVVSGIGSYEFTDTIIYCEEMLKPIPWADEWYYSENGIPIRNEA